MFISVIGSGLLSGCHTSPAVKRAKTISPAPGVRQAEPDRYLAGICAELEKSWPSNRTVNIVCHGHSVPAGYFRTPRVETLHAYPFLLLKGLKQRFPYAVINVISTGIGGENAASGARRFKHDVLALHPDVVTIDYALNDRALGLARAAKAWKQMITEAKAAGVKVILLTPTPDLTANLDDPRDPLNLHAEQIRGLAKAYGVGLVDSLARFKAAVRSGVPLKDLMAQSNHPNARGHELVAEELLKWFPAGATSNPVKQVKGKVFAPGPDGALAVTIDGRRQGLVFDGVGAVSAGGSSRLLVDYPEPERSQILDYLFRPDYGAALQILKVEIGADTDATCGAEPSHEREPGKIESNLGYEWWLMKEARARNPRLKLMGLAWGAPGWLKGGYWSDDNLRYTLAWLDCAKQHGLKIDYLGGGNERGWQADYYIKLARALKEHGYGEVKVVATDDHNPPNYWAVATAMKTNAAFAGAVDVIGEHDVCGWRTLQKHCQVSADALSLGKPLWDSENSTQDYWVGAEPLARAMTRHYLDGGVTGNLNWALAAAFYGDFPCAGTGLILADRPWSGYYDLGPDIWVDAHVTQFTQPGWRYLDAACGYTAGGASLVTLRSPHGRDYTMVVETMDLAAPETLAVQVTNGLSTGPVQLWSTDLRSHNESKYFVHAGTIQPASGRYRVRIEPGHIYTLSTTTGQRKGAAQGTARSSERMPLPYSEDFEHTGPDHLARYFSDVHGGFQAAPCRGGRAGRCYRQMVGREPILWHGAKMPPTTIVGDPRWWGDYEVGADALLEEPSYVELLGRIESQQHTVAGYHLRIADTGAWRLYTEDVAGRDTLLASGTNAPFGVGQWHRLALRFAGEKISARLDGQLLADVRDDSHRTGQVGLRVSPWQHAEFDNVRVVRTAPWRAFIPHSEMTISASSESAGNDFGQTHSARMAIDDRVETWWRSAASPRASAPQTLTLDLGRERSVQALVYRPPVSPPGSGSVPITDYAVALSDDGRRFQPVTAGRWKANLSTKIASWPRRTARFVRLEAKGNSSQAKVTAAEIEIAVPPGE